MPSAHSIRTRVTELFGSRLPIVQAGMAWTSGVELVVACANAGAVGLLGAGTMTPEQLRDNIAAVRARVASDAVWGVNVPVFYPHAAAVMDLLVADNIRIVFTSGGSPKTHTARLKAAGAIVVHVAPTARLAKKCEDEGCDAVVVEGFEAGGHNGKDELTTMVLVPQAVDAVRIPVIAAGGIATGRQMAAAMALGADGVQIGSRFAASAEASCHPNFKRAIVEADETATMLAMKKLTPVRALKNAFLTRIIEAEQAGAPRETISEMLGRGRSHRGMFDGDVNEGELEIGQVAGMIAEVQTADAILADILTEFCAVIPRLGALLLP